MALLKVVVQFKDGNILKGRSSDFSPEKKTFHLKLINREEVKINADELKAVFFIKDFKGNRDHQARYKDALPWGGKKVKVIFSDGEEIIGYVQHYLPEVHGFFLTPADLKSNNERIFVIVSSTEKITYL